MNDSRRDAAVHFYRMDCRYLVSPGEANPASLRQRLDRIAQGRLGEICARLLDQALDPQDESVWILRDLSVNLSLVLGVAEDIAWDEERLARDWARAVIQAIARHLDSASIGKEVLRFPSRAAYLAQFAADLAEGQAWGRWYYQAFEGLRSLPASQALAEALVRDPQVGEAALRLLETQGRLDRMIESLSENGAQRVFAALSQGTQEPSVSLVPAPQARGELRRRIEILAEAWSRWLSPVSGGRAALRLYLVGRKALPDNEGASGEAWGVAVKAFLSIVDLAKAAGPQVLARALSSGDVLQARQLVLGQAGFAGALPGWVELARGEPDWMEKIATSAAGSPLASGAAEAGRASGEMGGEAGRVFLSDFGGVFLLLPGLIDLQIDDALLRYWALVKCFGRAQASRAMRDPAICLAAGLDAPPEAETLSAWAEQVGAAPETALQGRLVGRLAELRRVEGRRLLAEHLHNLDGADLLLVRDLSQDVWCALLPVAPEQRDAALSQALELIRAALGGQPAEELLLAPGMEQAVLETALFPALRPVSSGFKSGAADLDYFSLEELPGPAGRLSTLVARAILKSLGRRLLGFHESSAAYLVRNFLTGNSRIAVEPGRVTVTLPLPPLHVILNMTGVDGRTYSLPWPPGCEILTRLRNGEEG